jgi:hypothetical protein
MTTGASMHLSRRTASTSFHYFQTATNSDAMNAYFYILCHLLTTPPLLYNKYTAYFYSSDILLQVRRTALICQWREQGYPIWHVSLSICLESDGTSWSPDDLITWREFRQQTGMNTWIFQESLCFPNNLLCSSILLWECTVVLIKRDHSLKSIIYLLKWIAVRWLCFV